MVHISYIRFYFPYYLKIMIEILNDILLIFLICTSLEMHCHIIISDTEFNCCCSSVYVGNIPQEFPQYLKEYNTCHFNKNFKIKRIKSADATNMRHCKDKTIILESGACV